MVYSAETQRRFESPAASGELEGADVHHGVAGRVTDGTWVRFTVRLGCGDAALCVADVRFRAFGCPHVLAAADLISELGTGRPVSVDPCLTLADLRRRLDAPIDKLGRLLIVEDAWVAAMRAAGAQVA